MSITASWLILAIILIRLFLKKAPKWISCALWVLAAIRLICPFSFESKLSLIPTGQTIPRNIAMQAKPQIDSGIAIVNNVVNPVIARRFTPDPMTSANPLQIVLSVLSIVWLIGMLVLLTYALVSYIRLKKSTGASIAVRDNILACDEVKSPFILGILRPMIYVPSGLKGQELEYVITHENSHLMRHDHWWKPVGYLLLTVYWFNPLCWLAYKLLSRDIELACDEKVVRDMDNRSKVAYSQALLNCSYMRKQIIACPLAFGEIGVKERVKTILNYKKPAFWVIVVAMLACIAAAVCLLTDPISKQDTMTFTHRSTSIGNRADFDIHFGQKARSAELAVELWQYGEKTAESTMIVPSDTQKITVLFSDLQEDMYLTGEIVQIDTDQTAGSLVTLFPVPEGVRGWSFTSWSEGQTINIEAGKESILAAMNFDTGKGTRSVFDLLEENNQQIPADIDCVLMVRAIFSAEDRPGTMETAADSLVPDAAATEPGEAVEWAETEMPSPVGTYKCEDPGFGGDFVLTLHLDRTFSYSEGPCSSYFGTGEWTAVNETTIELVDRNLDEERCTYFTFNGRSLMFDKNRSAAFTYVDLPDNAVFNRVAEEALSDEVFECIGRITEIKGGIIRLQDLTGSVPGIATQILYVPITNIASSPEPQVGDRLIVHYQDFLTEEELTDPIEIMEISADAITGLRVIRDDNELTIRDVAFCVDNVVYRSTGRAVPVEPDESSIRYAEIPVGGANAKQITAYAILNNGISAVALYDGEWYEFTALDEDSTVDRVGDAREPASAIVYVETLPDNAFTRVLTRPLPGNIDHVIDDSENNGYAVFFSGTDHEKSAAYVEELKRSGYSTVVSAEESGINTCILQKDDSTLSIAYEDGQMSIMIGLAQYRTAMDVEINYGSSSVYTTEDMMAAIGVITDKFVNTFDGCVLHSLSYMSDDICNDTQNIVWMNELERANDNKEVFTQCIAFKSSFHSPVNGGGAWVADEEYTWSWWLARSDGGKWKLMTWGY